MYPEVMSAAHIEDEPEDDDLLPDDLRPKGSATPLRRTAKQIQKAQERAIAQAEAGALEVQQDRAKATAAQLAQVVNLTIAGFSFEEIGLSIGASPEDIEKMLTNDTARFVKTQPALRLWVRNFISGKYTALLDAVWDEATDKAHKEKLEHQDRAVRILDRMAKLHGAEAPVQSEVKMDATPEAVDLLVQRLAAGQGMGYDPSIFDLPAEEIHEIAVVEEHKALVSGNAVGESDGDDTL